MVYPVEPDHQVVVHSGQPRRPRQPEADGAGRLPRKAGTVPSNPLFALHMFAVTRLTDLMGGEVSLGGPR